ncbi:MAG: hypothetical protein ACOCV3_04800 [Halanaerobiales bacterium]
MGLINKPYTFSTKVNADPTQVNATFDALYTLVNGNLDENNINYSLATVKNALLTALKGVDGADSGLDADLLDGKEYSEISSEIDNKSNTAQTAAQTYTDNEINKYLPKGIISMWSGSINSIPSTWALCNGSNGTPDLRNRFVVGAGDDYAVGDKGGANNVALTEANLAAHTHGVGTLVNSSVSDHNHSFSGSSGSAGSHNHSGSANSNGNHWHYILNGHRDNAYGFSTNQTLSESTGHGGSENYNLASNTGTANKGRTNTKGDHTHSLSINSNGAHTHSISGSIGNNGAHNHTISGSTASTGSGSAHENRPPYYALAYIMKL